MSSPNTIDSFLRWDPAQVANYINSVVEEGENDMGSAFLEHNIEGVLLPYLTTEHLMEIGITRLRTRLQIKRAITELITSQFDKKKPRSLLDEDYRPRSFNINNNYVNLEALTVSTVLMRGILKKMSITNPQVLTPTSPPTSNGQSQLDITKLNENFNKLKTDLIPVIRLVKESKPLPTPTLDPGSSSAATEYQVTLPVQDTYGEEPMLSPDKQSQLVTNVAALGFGNGAGNRGSVTRSPSYSKRFSTASVLSMGTGKVAQQVVARPVTLDSRHSSEPTLLRSGSKSSIKQSPLKPSLKLMNFLNSTQTLSPAATSTTNNLSSNHTPLSSTAAAATAAATAANEPLKQLKASSDDSCLKILQQAMKRHHIPRSDWLKYVLVICYGDKERILKLAEKPVIIFKELLELGKHPAIMLRQLASDTDEENGNYEDSRIGDDVPGGTL